VYNGTARAPKSLKNSNVNILLIGADVLGLDRIPWSETKENLERIIGERVGTGATAARISIDIVEGATRASVNKALDEKPYDIVHFIGHGRPDGIFLRGKNREGVVLPTRAFSAMLSGVDPALVILSACDTARLDDVAPLGTIAEALVVQAAAEPAA
jgi:hypothetical protein